MKTCPVCEKGFSDEHRTCPTDGAVLIESHELEPGAVVRAKYRIVRKIGQGGMGVVYLADNMLMSVRVALKFLSGELGRDTRFIKRFRNEARAAFMLRHPNVAEVIDLDQAEDGALFIAMEFVDGPGLRQVIESAPQGLPIPSALALIRGIAAGLGAAHERGTVHRDIKPENILLTAATRQPKILDFGIAAVMESATQMSRTNGPLFTAEYAAPEQWKGMPSAELDGRTDIYALGGVFYELLTGQTAFHAHNIQGWMYQHLNETPVAPSQIRPELRSLPGLDELVLAMLARERENRPATIGDFLQWLDSLRAEGQPPAITNPRPPNVSGPGPYISGSGKNQSGPGPYISGSGRNQSGPGPYTGGSGYDTIQPEPAHKHGLGKWIGVGLVGLPVLVLALIFLFRPKDMTATPVLTPGGGTYAATQAISISDSTSEAVIHYTTDGTQPSESSPVYTDPLQNLRSGTVVRAIAVASGHKPSSDVTGVYIWGAGGGGGTPFDQGKVAYDRKQYVQARTLFTQSCDAGNMSACNYLGYIYANGLGGARDTDQAKSLYRKSCEGGIMNSCASLGSIYQDAGNADESRIYYKKACDGGSTDGCKLLRDLK